MMAVEQYPRARLRYRLGTKRVFNDVSLSFHSSSAFLRKEKCSMNLEVMCSNDIRMFVSCKFPSGEFPPRFVLLY